jgi:hypothetical protein
MTENIKNCGWEVRWLFLAVGIPVALIGGLFTASVIGAIFGIPLLLLASPSGSAALDVCDFELFGAERS